MPASPPLPARVQGLLLDLDGVLFQGDDAIPGSLQAVRRLQRAGLALRFITNTTTRPREALLRKLQGLGYEVPAGALFTPAVAARRVMSRDGPASYRLLGHPALEEDLGPGAMRWQEPATPRWLVLALHPPLLAYEPLNLALRDLLAGARLLTLYATRTCRGPQGMELGLGAWMRALEFGARGQATVVGKPAAAYFQEALAELGLPPGEALMVGDDVDSDVGGAQALGIPGVLVRTGKHTERALRLSEVEPAWVADDLGKVVERVLAGRPR